MLRRMTFNGHGSKITTCKELALMFLGVFCAVAMYLAYRIGMQPEECYGIVMDAGSSGTKLSVYTWPCLRSSALPDFQLNSYKSKKFTPPLTHIISMSELQIDRYFEDLFEFADSIIP